MCIHVVWKLGENQNWNRKSSLLYWYNRLPPYFEALKGTGGGGVGGGGGGGEDGGDGEDKWERGDCWVLHVFVSDCDLWLHRCVLHFLFLI